MAFAKKLGSLLTQSVTKNVGPSGAIPRLSVFNAVRNMSSSKLFVGGLPWGTDDEALKQAFSEYGQVIEAKVIVDRESGRSRGFGFVTYTSSEEAAAGLQMDGQELQGRAVRVNYATERSRGPGGFGGGSFGGGGFGGGYGGGSYGGRGGFGGGNYGGRGGFGGGNYGGGDGFDDDAAASDYGSGNRASEGYGQEDNFAGGSGRGN
eukprot:TRINITY_DN915_c0_g1_i3.p1 TRINITY_DN915_c0_g1~~TRINITY_DN915_c0_g1_i3.p1  ORF type:complete len:206 (-),score=63.03 TRINITY_DN915_c0_g1_i3:250-867(-)